MNKKTLYITICIVVLLAGNLFRDLFVESLRETKPADDLGKVNYAFKSKTDIALFGASTSYMTFNPSIIEKKLGLSSYNFGISGAVFHQQWHIDLFNENNTNKYLIWVVNPFSLNQNFKPKLVEDEFFIHYSQINSIEDHFNEKRLGKGTFLRYLGWNNIFHFNSKHWGIITGSPQEKLYDKFGFHTVEKEFVAKNDYLKDSIQIDLRLFHKLISTCKRISKRNNIIVVFPPNYDEINVKNISSKLTQEGITNIDYSNFFKKDLKLKFHDKIHLNTNATTTISNQLARDLEIIFSNQSK